MFDVRKIQEQVIYNAVKTESNDKIAYSIVNGNIENNATWVKNTMKRLEDNFDKTTIKKIRTNCQCGYGMDGKLAFLNELIASSSSLEEFACHEKARASGLSFRRGTQPKAKEFGKF